MPAAIRIDVDLCSIAASDERLAAMKPRVRGLAYAIADAVRKAVVLTLPDSNRWSARGSSIIWALRQSAACR